MAIIFVYLFFTLAKTKMTTFTGLVLPLVIIVLANFLVSVINFIKIKRVHNTVLITSTIAVTTLLLDINLILKTHTLTYIPEESKGRKEDIEGMKKIKEISKVIKDDKAVIFNCRSIGNIKIMFYTNFTAYDFIPSEKQCELVKRKGYKIAILQDGNLPAFIENDKDVIKLAF